MANRTAKFVSAVFASILVSGHLTTASNNAAHAATEPEAKAEDKCLSKPKGAPPEGGHWYYRIDRATKKNCWYIGDEKEKPARAASQESSPPASSAPLPRKPAAPPSISNARAELPMPQTRVEQETNAAAAAPHMPAPVANIPRPDHGERTNVMGGDRQQSAFVFSSRWPEVSGVNSSASPAPAAPEQVASQQPAPAAAAPAAPPPPVAAAPIKLAAAADPLPEKASGSIQMLLAVIFGALCVAGLIASAIFKFGSARSARQRHVKVDRRAIWDSVPDDSPATRYHIPTAYMPKVNVLREERTSDNDRIAEMLARLARSAQT